MDPWATGSLDLVESFLSGWKHQYIDVVYFVQKAHSFLEHDSTGSPFEGWLQIQGMNSQGVPQYRLPLSVSIPLFSLRYHLINHQIWV